MNLRMAVHWKEINRFVDNFIKTKEITNALDDLNALLYNSDEFCAIKNTECELEVTENALQKNQNNKRKNLLQVDEE